jgi:glycerol kinase
MQFQADILDVNVVRPRIAETTALGAAYAAGLAVGFWKSREDLIGNWGVEKRWKPDMPQARRAQLYQSWQKAVGRSYDWKE